MSEHRAPCTDGDVCGDTAHCPPEYPSDAQGPVAPESEPLDLDLDAVEREIRSIYGADRTTCRALVSEIRRLSQICARHSREAWDEGFTAATDAAPEDVWPEAWNYVPNPYGARGAADQKSHAAHHGPDCACLLPERARAEAEEGQWERMCRGAWRSEVHLAERADHWRARAEAAEQEVARLRAEVKRLRIERDVANDSIDAALLAGAGERPDDLGAAAWLARANPSQHIDLGMVAAEIAAARTCPTCSPPIRETVGMVCQTCGTDYGRHADLHPDDGADLRERIARALHEHRSSTGDFPDGLTGWDALPESWRDEWREAADAVLAVVRPLLDLIEHLADRATSAAELDALPTTSIVRTDDAQVWQRTPSGWDCLSEDGTGGTYDSQTVLYQSLPASVLVLYRAVVRPDEQAGR